MEASYTKSAVRGKTVPSTATQLELTSRCTRFVLRTATNLVALRVGKNAETLSGAELEAVFPSAPFKCGKCWHQGETLSCLARHHNSKQCWMAGLSMYLLSMGQDGSDAAQNAAGLALVNVRSHIILLSARARFACCLAASRAHHGFQ